MIIVFCSHRGLNVLERKKKSLCTNISMSVGKLYAVSLMRNREASEYLQFLAVASALLKI